MSSYISVNAGPDKVLGKGYSFHRGAKVVSVLPLSKLKYNWKQTHGPKQKLQGRKNRVCKITGTKKGWCMFRFVARIKGQGWNQAAWDYFILEVK